MIRPDITAVEIYNLIGALEIEEAEAAFSVMTSGPQNEVSRKEALSRIRALLAELRAHPNFSMPPERPKWPMKQKAIKHSPERPYRHMDDAALAKLHSDVAREFAIRNAAAQKEKARVFAAETAKWEKAFADWMNG